MLAHSYAEHGNWYVMVILDAYQIEGTDYNGTTHYSPWSYDRHVPLAFYGAPFAAGEYHERVAPVDLAVTFASLAGRQSALGGRGPRADGSHQTRRSSSLPVRTESASEDYD